MKRKILTMLREIHSDSRSKRLSSKRVYGAIGFVSCLILSLATKNTDLIEVIIYVSAGMIGLDTVMKAINKPKYETEDKDQENLPR